MEGMKMMSDAFHGMVRWHRIREDARLVDKTACRRASASRSLLRGGNLNNGANAGGWNLNVNNGLSNSNANYGCRLAAGFLATARRDLLVNSFSHHVLVGWPERTGYNHAVRA